MAAATICPGCAGPKSRRAGLCRTCRLKANTIGAHVVVDVAPNAPEHRTRTPVQNTIYHARLNDLAKIDDPHASVEELRLRVIELKIWALTHASRTFGRSIESSTELSETEMERLLEWLDHEYLLRARQSKR
jgi:hypothetical protein